MSYLYAWLLIAATVVLPFSKYVPATGSKRFTRWTIGCILGLLWPFEMFMLLRLQFLKASIGVMGNVA